MNNRLLIWGAAALASLTPLYLLPLNWGRIHTNVFELFLIIWLVSWLVFRGMWRARELKALWRGLPLRYPLLIFFAAATISVWIAADRLSALGYWKSYFLIPILLYIALVYERRQNSKLIPALLYGLGSSLIAAAGYALFQVLTQKGIPAPWNEVGNLRATAWYPYPNALALFAAPLTVLFFALYLARSVVTNRYFALLASVGGAAAVVSSVSVGGIAGVVAGILLVLFINKKYKIAGVLVLILAISIGITISYLKLPDVLLTKKNVSADVRLVLWTGTWRMITAHPIWGVGLGGFVEQYETYKEPTHTEIALYPHQVFLNFWVETGILGLIGFAAVISGALGLIKKYSDGVLSVALAGFLMALLIHGLVDVPYLKNDLAVVFWMIMVLLPIIPRPGAKILQ